MAKIYGMHTRYLLLAYILFQDGYLVMFARVHKRAQMFLREFLSGFLELILTDLFIKFQVAVTREATKRNICVEREYA